MFFQIRFKFLLRAVFLAYGLIFLTYGKGNSDPGFRIHSFVDRNRVEVGEEISLTVSVSSQGSGLRPVFDTPDGLEVLGRTSSSSTSISIVNGVMETTHKISFVYTLKAQREGSFVIGPARVTHQGRTYASSKIRIDVIKRDKRKQTRSSSVPGDQLPSEELQRIEENLFVQAELEKSSVYVGEQINIAYNLYTRYALKNVHYGDLPEFIGFWVETLFEAKRLNFKKEELDGRTFEAALLKKIALFPTYAGLQKVDQLEVVCDIPRLSRRRSLFDLDVFDPFQTNKVTVRSEKLDIKVNQLPPGAPKGFSGAVGEFQILADAVPKAVMVGDPIVLNVTVSGWGNLNAVSELILPSGGPIHFYDPKISVEIQKRAGKIGGQKLYEYVVIPQEIGNQEIPSLRLVYFDLEAEQYAFVETLPIPLVVTPGLQTKEPDLGPVLSREEVKLLGEDIRHIKPDQIDLEHQGRMLYRDWRFLALQGVPILGLLGVIVFKRHQGRLIGDVAYARRRRSRSDARRRLAQARRMMRSGEMDMFHTEIYRALSQFLADRLNCPAAGMTVDAVSSSLKQRMISSSVIDRTVAILQQCDYARFTPIQDSTRGLEILYKDVEGLIEELGRRV